MLVPAVQHHASVITHTCPYPLSHPAPLGCHRAALCFMMSLPFLTFGCLNSSLWFLLQVASFLGFTETRSFLYPFVNFPFGVWQLSPLLIINNYIHARVSHCKKKSREKPYRVRGQTSSFFWLWSIKQPNSTGREASIIRTSPHISLHLAVHSISFILILNKL